MDAIPETARSSIYKDLPEKTRGTTFRSMERSWRYRLDIGVYHGHNPFIYFLTIHCWEKCDTGKLEHRALRSAFLLKKVGHVLNQAIRDAASDNTKMIGPFLIKNAEFTSDACNLTLAVHHVLEYLTGKRLERKTLTVFCRNEPLCRGMAPHILAPDFMELRGIGVKCSVQLQKPHFLLQRLSG